MKINSKEHLIVEDEELEVSLWKSLNEISLYKDYWGQLYKGYILSTAIEGHEKAFTQNVKFLFIAEVVS